MSLISQNAKTKSRVKKSKSDSDEPAFMGGSEHVEDGKESELRVTKSKKRRKEEEQLEIEEGREIKRLESFLFGSLYEPVEFGKHEDDGFLAEKENGSAMFFVDRSANNELALYDNELGISETDNDDKQTKELKAVWVDEEEEKTEVNIVSNNRLRKLRKEEDESLISGSEYVARLRAQHAKLNPGTDWARLDYQARDDDFSDDEPPHKQNGIVAAPGYDYAEAFGDILRSNEDLVVKSSTKLFPGILEYSRLVDANAEERSNGPINSVQFHQNGQLLLAAGLDRRIRFFQIDGKRNTKIQSIFIEDCPIRKASFLPDGSQVIISGRRKFFYSFDLVKAKVDKIGPLVGRDERSLENFEISPDSKMIAFTGNDGYILLVSSKTKELIGTLKMNGQVHSLAFADDGRQLLSHGSDGQIYHWDLRTMSCFHKGVDEGCIDGTTLCTSPTGNFFSAGSVNGIVNVYNREEFLGGKRKPAKVIGNLTTRVDFMKFNHDAQILAICSRMKKDSLKLVHVPSFTVFSNWPPPNRSMQYPHCLDFSHYGGFMAVGNAAGKVLLYKLHHYHHV